MSRRGLALTLLLLLAACSSAGDEGNASGRSSQSPSPPRSPEPATPLPDLAQIVLQADEAPEGTRQVEGVGGEQDLDAFARDATERAALVEDGFVSGYVSYFAPEAYFDPEAFVGRDDTSYQVIAGLFEHPEGASSSLHRFMGDLRDRQLQGAEDAVAPSLGDESFGLAGTSSSDGSAVLVLLWRQGNVLLVLVASGAVDEGAATRAARTMAEHVA
jgi:hypothetical protein